MASSCSKDCNVVRTLIWWIEQEEVVSALLDGPDTDEHCYIAEMFLEEQAADTFTYSRSVEPVVTVNN